MPCGPTKVWTPNTPIKSSNMPSAMPRAKSTRTAWKTTGRCSRRCVRGTYIRPTPFHLFRYLDEEAFRFNEREDNDGGRFRKVAGGIAGKRLTYKRLTGKAD